MAAPKTEPKGIAWKGWAALAITLVATVVGATLWLDSKFNALDTRDQHVDMAVRIVGAKQGGDTKALMDEALAMASIDSSNGYPDRAIVALNIANHLVREQKEAHAAAPQEAFSNALAQYQTLKKTPALRSAAHEGIIQLAEYRTDAETPSVTKLIPGIGHMRQAGNLTYLSDSTIVGENYLVIGPEGKGTDIDGFIMQNVVFQDVTIFYGGGPLIMQNVRFINCRFKVSDSPQGDQLLTAAVEQQTDAKIG